MPGSIIPSPGAPGAAPNVTVAIPVDHDYPVGAGQTLLTTNLPSLFVNPGLQTTFFTLANNGSLWSEGDGDVSIVNAFNFGQIINTGLMVASSSTLNVETVIVDSTFYGLNNSGEIYAIAPNGTAWAESDWSSGASIVNSGLIAAQGLGATAINRFNGGAVINTATGSILAEGPSAIGVYLGGGHVSGPLAPAYGPDIDNHGLIEAVSTDVSKPSAAIIIGHEVAGTVVIQNAGEIAGDFAIYEASSGYVPPTTATTTVINQAGGIIEGEVTLGDGATSIINQGLIQGYVDLGLGDDTFDNTAGQLIGAAEMGWGADSFIGGSGTDAVLGDRGDDTLNGNGGNDLLLGGRGDDTLTGGTGNDGLYGESGNDLIFTQAGDHVEAGAGDDKVVLGDYAFASVDGGQGRDILVLPNTAKTLDLHAALVTGRLSGFEEIDLPGAQRLVVRPGDVAQLTGTSQLFVSASPSGTVDLLGAWSANGVQSVGGVQYQTYVSGAAEVLVAGGSVAILGSAPSNASGLDPVAAGPAAPLPGSVPGAVLDSSATQANDLALYASLTIDADETWSSTAGAPVFGGGAADVQLVNNGHIVSSGGVAGATAAIIGGLGSFTNTGAVTASAEDNGANLAGSESELSTYGIANAVQNSPGNVFGAGNNGLSGPLSNTGSISAASDGAIATAYNTWSMDATNAGSISATSSQFVAVGVYAHNGGLLTNTGAITADGKLGAYGVGASTYGLTLDNQGQIIATSHTAGDPSYGIAIYYTATDSTLFNSGTISADIAIQLSWTINGGGLYLDNSGQITGQIQLDVDPNGGPTTRDVIINRGTITGDVHMGGERDIYDGSAGTTHGVIYGEDGSDLLIGGAAADTLNGGAGDDAILGGGGADALTGGAGADVFIYHALSDSPAAAPDTITDFQTGTDRIDLSALAPSSVSLSLAGGVTTLTATTAQGVLVIDIDGAVAQSDLILGPISTIQGTAGVDLLVATAGGSTLQGAGGNDMLVGSAGNDVLDGGAGIDLMVGGAGDDTYRVDDPGDVIRERPNEGVDTVEVNFPSYYAPSYILPDNVENAVLVTAQGAVGNALANTITGNAGANTLDGGAGADTLIGGGGADTYYVDNPGDVVVENAGEGADTIIASVSYALPANVENLTLAPGAGSISGTGNGLDNTIVGNEGDNTLSGAGGADAISGGDGADTISGGDGADVVHGGNGNDVITGDAGDDQVWGDAGADVIIGGDGADLLSGSSQIIFDLISQTYRRASGEDFSRDVLTGGAGADTLDGGGGIDTAVYSVASTAASLTRHGDGTWTVNAGADGVDTLSDVELLQFSDHDVSLIAELAQWSDFNGDGKSNLLIENTSGVVVFGEVQGGQAHYTAVASLGPEWSFRSLGDFIGDGYGEPSSLMANTSRAQFLIENTAGAVAVGDMVDGQLTYTTVAALGPEWKFNGSGDFLLHGDDQFLIENGTGALAVGEVIAGQATFTFIGALGPEWTFRGVGDFLGDGRSDFLIENSSGEVVVGEVTGGQAVYTTVGGLGPEWAFKGTGDFLGDGKADFLIENAAGVVVAAEVNNGQAVYTQVAALGSEWKFVGAGDYLGEGHDQFLIENDKGVVVVGDWQAGQIHYTAVASLGSEWAFHA